VTAGKEGGTGLGLAIVKKIAEEHGGAVDVRSSERGATFEIRIPQVVPAVPPSAPPRVAPAEHDGDGAAPATKPKSTGRRRAPRKASVPKSPQ
jgi:hypothetical protein